MFCSVTFEEADMSKTMNDMSLELAVRTQLAVTDLVERARERLVREEGQAAAEYLGIILVVAAIIGAIFATGLGNSIFTKLKSTIDSIGPKGSE
jgi:hypothetical protein